MTQRRAIETRAITGAEASRSSRSPLVTPIVQSANFTATTLAEWVSSTERDFDYTRLGNPTLDVVEQTLADLEEGAAGLVFGSGMAAISTTLLALLKPGDHVIAHAQLFYGTYSFLCEWLPRLDIDVSFVDLNDPNALERHYRPGVSRALYVETPTNPSVQVLDLAVLGAYAREQGLIGLIDNTVATPSLQTPDNPERVAVGWLHEHTTPTRHSHGVHPGLLPGSHRLGGHGPRRARHAD